jgi:hydroxypyruvate isomerase
MTRFSANLGFLWTDRPLPDAIRAAKAAGFDAVECHWPYEVPAAETESALTETGLTMLGLNTRRGDVPCVDVYGPRLIATVWLDLVWRSRLLTYIRLL